MAVDNKHREEQDLERYGVWVKAGPDELDGHDSSSLELMDIEDSDSEELLITEEEEMLLGELEESALPDFGDFDESFDSDLDDAAFDDEDFQLPSNEPDLSSETHDQWEDGESQGLLHKIEDDLNALRQEIRQLKDEITGLRVPSAPQIEPEAVEGGGFFDEEDDETIALTGDELDNILDSADMTEESRKQPESAIVALDEDISLEDEEEELIDLSGDFEDLGYDTGPEAEPETEKGETDPALSILSSPDEPEIADEPETIEIDIPGVDDTIDLGTAIDESVVSIDDISEETEEAGKFEEITDLEDFGLESVETVDISHINTEHEEVLPGPVDEYSITEDLGSETFDEGEEVEIDLSGVEDDLEVVEDNDLIEVEMEEISLDDFDMEENETESPVAEEKAPTEPTIEDETDVLAVDDDNIDLEELQPESPEDDEIVENIELESVLADKIDENTGLDDFEDLQLEEIEPEDLSPFDEQSDSVIEVIDLDADDEEKISAEEFKPEDNEESDLGDLDIEEIDLGSSGLEELEELEDLDGEELLDEVELDEVESETVSGPSDAEDIPDISLDGIIEEIETPEEFSIDGDQEIESEEILDLEPAEEESSEFEVSLPIDDDFNVLPGTEEVDLESLEALAATPELGNDEFTAIEIEEIEPDATPVEGSPSAGLSDKAKTALGLESLPGELKDEIKDVLRYMDQLLESLPDDKIQEFARSEHFEVYKKIFEELGISD